MKKLLTAFAQTISVVLHPIFIPSYGTFLVCLYSVNQIGLDGIIASLIYTALTFFCTAFFPLTTIYIMKKNGKISDYYLSNPKERIIPYIVSIVSMLYFLFVFSRAFHINSKFIACYIAGTVALTLVFIINFWWKISIHLTAIGVLIGSIMLYANSFAYYKGITIALMLIALLLMYARIYLKAHTPLQVVCGFLLGLLITIPLFYLY